MMASYDSMKADLDNVRRGILSEIRDYLMAVGYAAARADIYGLGSIRHTARWWRGHGGSLWFELSPVADSPIEIKHEHYTNWGRRDVFGRFCVLSAEECIGLGDAWYSVADIVQGAVAAMLPDTKWETRLVPCCGPYHDGARPVSICKQYGDKWLCERCEQSFALTVLPLHVPMAGTQEQSERAKMTAAVRWQVLERDGFTCQACGATGPDVKLHVDHKIPIAKGGKTTLDNLHVLCAPCNLGKRDKMPRQETLDLWGLAAD